MNKTKTRVLSMVLTVFMLVSMLTAFAVAEAAPFATAYECGLTVEGVPQIKNTALLVDTTITEENGATVTRNWDGNDYTFVVGTNAFKALADAYAYAAENGIICPDIIITGWTVDAETGIGADLNIEAASNIYGPNWNTAPMNEMTDKFNAIESNGADWTANETYAANEMRIGSIYVKGSPKDTVGVYGFTITRYITLGKERSVGAPYVEFMIKNCKMFGINTNANILTGYQNTDVSCQDRVTFKNFWLDTIGGTSTGASRFFGDNTRHLPHMVFDGLYIDFSKSDLGFKKTNDHLKAYFSHTSLTFNNSNLRRSKAGGSPYWNLAQNTGSAITRELYYDNTVLYDTNQSAGFIYLFDGGYSTVSITNNFVITTPTLSATAKPLFCSNGSDQGIVTDKTYIITGNKFLGVNPKIDTNLRVKVPMFIEDNFTVEAVKETLEEYLTEPGVPLTADKGYSTGSSGSYIYNYDMKFSSAIKVVDASFGPASEVELSGDSISVKCLGEQSVVTPSFVINPNSAAKGEVATQLSSASDFSDTVETVDIAKIAETKTATFFLRAYYVEKPAIETVYQIKVIAAIPVDFNDSFMENGFELAGNKFSFNDTAIYVNESILEEDGNYYGYGFLGDNYYRFKVDNALVFDSMSLLKTQMTGVKSPNVLLPSGEYGDFTFEYAANYFGTNAGINPVVKGEAVTGEDDTYNEKFGAYADTAFDTIYFADGLEGKISFNGVTLRGQVNDTLRTMGKDGVIYGNLDITFINTVVNHIRNNIVVDDRNAGLINAGIGDSTVDRVFNLINPRSVNAYDSQIEFIENQFMSIDYFGFSKNYADSFNVKNLYVKDMRNASRLFADFVPAHVTFDGLYIDFAALGEGVDNTVGYFKTGAAVKNGSFTIINSNIRNGNTGNTVVPISVQGPRGDSEVNKLAEDYKYDVVINDNVFFNAVPSAAAGKSYIMVASTMISSLEVKDNMAFQTGTNAKKKAFILSNTAAALKPYYADADLAIIGNCTIDNNWLIGFDDKDAALDIGLEENNPVMTNAFVSEEDDAHTKTELLGIYSTSFGDEKYYLDFAKTVSNEEVLAIGVKASTENIKYVEAVGFDVSARIYGGTLAELVFEFKGGEAKGYWASNKTGTKELDPTTINVTKVGVGSTKTYYYVVKYTHNEVEYDYIYTVKIIGSVVCATHKWALSGTYNNDATCQKNGTQVVACQNKGCIETKVIEKPKSMVPCNYVDYVSNNDANCVKAGTETGTCQWCGAKNTRENALLYPPNRSAHEWGEWHYNNDATCCKDGTETRVCDNGCGASQTQTDAEHLKATVAHTWGEYTYDGTATCEKDGTKSASCTVEGCRAVDTIVDPNFPASDKYHVWGEYVYNKDATTAADGTQTAVCSVCGDKHTKKAEGTKLPVTIVDSSKKFKDVKSAWYKTAVDYVTSHGFVSGVSSNQFGVGTSVTRGMFVTILARMAGVDTSTAANKAAATKFTDVAKGKYYAAAVKWANDNGIVSGTSATTFGPENAISRQDLCVMIVNYANFMGIKLVEKEAAVTFTDASSISKYAKAAVATCQRADIINGHTSGAFGPRDTATREQASQILYTLHSVFMVG